MLDSDHFLSLPLPVEDEGGFTVEEVVPENHKVFQFSEVIDSSKDELEP